MRPLLFLFFSVLILESLGNNTLPLIDRDEPRFAEASREIRQSGDFIIPRVNGAYRFDKQPLIYCCQVASSMVFGEKDFAVRFPSALLAAAICHLRRVAGPDNHWDLGNTGTNSYAWRVFPSRHRQTRRHAVGSALAKPWCLRAQRLFSAPTFLLHHPPLQLLSLVAVSTQHRTAITGGTGCVRAICPLRNRGRFRRVQSAADEVATLYSSRISTNRDLGESNHPSKP